MCLYVGLYVCLYVCLHVCLLGRHSFNYAFACLFVPYAMGNEAVEITGVAA